MCAESRINVCAACVYLERDVYYWCSPYLLVMLGLSEWYDLSHELCSLS